MPNCASDLFLPGSFSFTLPPGGAEPVYSAVPALISEGDREDAAVLHHGTARILGRIDRYLATPESGTALVTGHFHADLTRGRWYVTRLLISPYATTVAPAPGDLPPRADYILDGLGVMNENDRLFRGGARIAFTVM